MTLIGWPLARSTASGCARRGDLAGRHPECRVAHLQRFEHALVEKVRETLAGRGFDDAAEQIDRHAVFPHRARLMREWRLGEPLDLLRRRELARVVVANAREVEPCLDISIPDRSVNGDLAVGQSRRMAKQILHRHLALGRNRDVAHARELVVAASLR